MAKLTCNRKRKPIVGTGKINCSAAASGNKTQYDEFSVGIEDLNEESEYTVYRIEMDRKDVEYLVKHLSRMLETTLKPISSWKD